MTFTRTRRNIRRWHFVRYETKGEVYSPKKKYYHIFLVTGKLIHVCRSDVDFFLGKCSELYKAYRTKIFITSPDQNYYYIGNSSTPLRPTSDTYEELFIKLKSSSISS